MPLGNEKENKALKCLLRTADTCKNVPKTKSKSSGKPMIADLSLVLIFMIL